MTRTDIHRPSVIVPDDYEYVAHEYLKIECLGDAVVLQAERAIIEAHKARTGGTYSDHKHGGNCHICGSVNAIYTALFYHRPTNAYVRTGLDCAAKLGYGGNGELFRKKVVAALEQVAGKRKAQALLESKGLQRAWEITRLGYEFPPLDDKRLENQRDYDHSTACDIVWKLIKYGSLSDKQLAFLGKLVEKIDNVVAIEAARKAAAEAAKPVPVVEERIAISGKILTIRKQTHGWLVQGPRCLIEAKDGWKVWGTLPKALSGKVERGDVVEFTAKIKPSDKDPKFGFFSRPTKAKKVA
jgi:hypothetical protein